MVSINANNFHYAMTSDRALCLLKTLTSAEDFEYIKSQILKHKHVTLRVKNLIKYIHKNHYKMRRKNNPAIQVYLTSVMPTTKFRIYTFTYLEYQKIFENIKDNDTVSVTYS